MPDRPLRERILDAAAEIVGDRGWAAVTMGGLAVQVGVSRQSVYNEVGSKPALAEALVEHEFRDFLSVVEAGLSGRQDLSADVEATCLRLFAMAGKSPLLQAVISSAHGGASDLLPLLTVRSQPLVRAATEQVGTLVGRSYPGADPDVAEVLVRLVFSYVLLPAGDPQEAARRLRDVVERWNLAGRD